METEPSKGNRHDENQIRNKTASPARTRVEFLALVCATQSADRRLVRHPRRIPSLPLNGDTKMKTTNLKQTSVAKPRKWFQFRDQRSRLHLREFAKNSRIFRHPHRRKPGSCNFFSLVNQLFGTLLAFDMRMPSPTKGISTHETDTWNIARRRSWLSDDALDFSSARSTNSVGDISSKGAFEFLRSLLAAALLVFAPSRTRVA